MNTLCPYPFTEPDASRQRQATLGSTVHGHGLSAPHASPLLQRAISLHEAMSQGAPPGWNEAEIRSMFFRESATVTIEQVLNRDVPAGVRFWLVMRESLLPASLIHALALNLVERFLARAQADGLVVNSLVSGAITAKREWIERQISSAALAKARAALLGVRGTLAEQGDPRQGVFAKVACCIAGDEPRRAFLAAYYSLLDLYDDADEQQRCVDTVLQQLHALEQPEAA